MSELKVKKPVIKPLPLYLNDDMKDKVQKKASELGTTANGYIKMLINADLNK